MTEYISCSRNHKSIHAKTEIVSLECYNSRALIHQGRPGKGLKYSNNRHYAIDDYSNADYAGNIDDKKYISDFCTYLGGNLITRRNKKQNVVARLSCEVLYEVLWLKRLMETFGLTCS